MFASLFGKKPGSHAVRITPAAVEFRAGSKETLLQAALNQGIAFPHDCRAGGCGACKCRLVKGKVKVNSGVARGSGTLWTTGQVGNLAKTGAYYSSIWRTGYDNRTPGGVGNIQLVTPSLTHWLSPGWNSHTAQLGTLTIRVPEPHAVLLLVAGAGALAVLHRVSKRR